ncbi:asparaginase [Jeongeupia sp. USM3]|uniref:asparaginase n=1 Tax=Jeongeupia sp. USM3 TaxID=1906741 RepID=UPI00089DE88C|nr:asparaginase [Jeongeupia sp. USM3]AOX99651.1 hypothetical protein BJP62_03780 [Jeongeupia sp. USM3]
MPILVIYAGGTIGMRPGPGGLAPEAGALAGPLQALATDAKLVEYEPLLDSSAMGPAHWNRIAADIAAHRDAFDGFLVLHGTDTLAWTASALALQLRGLGKPVVLTGAMRPWFEPGSDAPDNVAAALALLRADSPFAEVGVVMAGRLWRGCRVRKLDCDHDDAFAAPNEAPLGAWSDGRWALDAARLQVPGAMAAVMPFDPTARVLHVQLAPGCTPAWLASALERDPPDALLLQSFGSGNLPDDAGLRRVLAGLAARIPVVNLTLCPRGRTRPGLYAASADGGLIDGGMMTPEAALAKLHAVLLLPGLAEQGRAFVTGWVGECGEADSLAVGGVV